MGVARGQWGVRGGQRGRGVTFLGFQWDFPLFLDLFQNTGICENRIWDFSDFLKIWIPGKTGFPGNRDFGK